MPGGTVSIAPDILRYAFLPRSGWQQSIVREWVSGKAVATGSEPAARPAASALRRFVLRITFDGAARPQVWCPLGDFFGSAPGFNPYKSLPVGMADPWTYAYWHMPFAKQAVVELVNEDTVEIVGANEQAVKSSMFGLDVIKLDAVK